MRKRGKVSAKLGAAGEKGSRLNVTGVLFATATYVARAITGTTTNRVEIFT
jgi:hypothetical protein